jgi:uncharacterized protein YceK
MNRIALALVAAVGLSGCAGLAFQRANGSMGGWIYSETKANDQVTDVSVTPAKTGEACSMSILGWVTTGDSSVPTAAKNGGIKKIASVDNNFMQVLGIYAKFCTVVTGE